MEWLLEYSAPVIVGICLCLGFMIKNVIPSDKINKFIPLIMGLTGVGINIWINLTLTPEILLTGLFSGLASTGLHQAFKSFLNKKKSNVEETEEIEE